LLINRKENKNTQEQSLLQKPKPQNDDLSKALKAFKSNVSLAMRENRSRDGSKITRYLELLSELQFGALT
jgi:hypothetical protein